MFGSRTWVDRQRGETYGEVIDVSLETSFGSKFGEVKEDRSLFELEDLIRGLSLGDRTIDIIVKICGDRDCKHKEDILPYYLYLQKILYGKKYKES